VGDFASSSSRGACIGYGTDTVWEYATIRSAKMIVVNGLDKPTSTRAVLESIREHFGKRVPHGVRSMSARL